MPLVLRIVLWLLLALTLLVLLLVVALPFVTGNVFKDEITAALSRQLGVPVAVKGNLDIDLRGDLVRVQADQIALGTASASRPPLLTMDRLRFGIALAPLLRGQLVLVDITVIHPHALITRNADGELNWNVLLAQAGGGGAVPRIEQFAVDGGSVVYRDAALKNDIELKIDRLEGSFDPKSTVAATGSGRIDDRDLRLQVTAEYLDEHWRADGALRLADARVSVAGTVRQPDLRLEADIPRPSQLDFLPLPDMPDVGPVQFSSRFTRDGNHWWLDDLKLSFGPYHVDGDIRLDLDQGVPMVYATLLLDELRLPKGGATSPREKLIPPTPIDLTLLRRVNAKANLRIGKLTNAPFTVQDIALTARLRNGRLVVSSASADLAGGRLRGEMTVDASAAVPSTTLHLTLHELLLPSLVPGLPAQALQGKTSGRIDLGARGKNLEALAASARGQLLFVIRDGAIRAAWIEGARLDLAEWLLLQAKPGTHETPIRCGLIGFAVRDGVLVPRPIVLDTRDSWLTIDGSINLNQETLELTLRAHPKDFSFLTAQAPVTVAGPFSDIAIDVPTGKLWARGAVALALGSLLAPVAAFIPFIEPGLASDRNCKQLLAGIPLGEASGIGQ